MLRALVLARHDDAGRQVRDAHRRVGDVDVLAAGAARAVGVDAQVLLVDLDVDVVGSSGQTNTDANEVWRRAAWSNGEMRTRRCTPASADIRPKAYSPVSMNVALLMPASSPGW